MISLARGCVLQLRRTIPGQNPWLARCITAQAVQTNATTVPFAADGHQASSSYSVADVVNFAVAQVTAARPDSSPFSHVVVNDFLPQSFYEDLCAHFPCQDLTSPQGDLNRDQLVDGKSTRFVLELDKQSDFVKLNEVQQRVWSVFHEFITSPRLMNSICTKLSSEYTQEIKESHMNPQLIYDTTGFAILPHCDSPTATYKGVFRDKLVTMLLYCAGPNANPELGTEFYRPDENGSYDASEGTYSVLPNYPGRFETVKRVPYVGNQLVAFLPVDGSTWHGRSKLDEVKDSERKMVQCFARPHNSVNIDYEKTRFLAV